MVGCRAMAREFIGFPVFRRSAPLKNLYSRDFWFFLSRKRTTLRLHKSKIYSQLNDLRDFVLVLFSGKKVPKKPPALRSLLPPHKASAPGKPASGSVAIWS
jgi:hypothetical protein